MNNIGAGDCTINNIDSNINNNNNNNNNNSDNSSDTMSNISVNNNNNQSSNIWSCGIGYGCGNTHNSQVPIPSFKVLNTIGNNSGDGVQDMTCSASSTFLVTDTGSVLVCGSGYLGIKSTSSMVIDPQPITVFNNQHQHQHQQQQQQTRDNNQSKEQEIQLDSRCKFVYSNSHQERNFTFFLTELGALYSVGSSMDFRTGLGTEIHQDSIKLMSGFDSAVKQVTIGVTHGVAITDTGSLYMWGRPFGFVGAVYPIPTKLNLKCNDNGLNLCDSDPIIQMVSGEGFTLFLKRSGLLYCHGGYDQNMDKSALDVNKVTKLKWDVLEDDHIKQIACGNNHVVLLTREGKVWTVGHNFNAALGIKSESYDLYISKPQQLSKLENVVYVYANHFQSFVICENGDIYSWGYNVKGSLGTKVIKNHSEPELVYLIEPIGKRIQKISACENYTLFLLSNQEWTKESAPLPQGNISNRHIQELPPRPYPEISPSLVNNTITQPQLWVTGSIFGTGNEPDEQMVIFREVKSLSTKGIPMSIAVGNKSSYITFKDGSMWDYGTGKAMGHGIAHDPCREPNRIFDLDSSIVVDCVSCEEDVCIAQTEKGTLYGWGKGIPLNGLGGDGDVYYPRLLEGFRTKIMKVTMSSTHCLAVDVDGGVYAWGSGKALGNRNRTSQESSPKKIQDQTFFSIDIACGKDFSMMLSDSGHILVFGEGLEGQLGLSNNKFASLPTLIKDLPERFVSIAAGPDYAAAVSQSGNVYMWGSNKSGLLLSAEMSISAPTKLPMFGTTIKIAAIIPGAVNCFAITTTGSLFGWGEPHLGVGTGLKITTPTRIESTQGLAVQKVIPSDWQTLAIVSPLSFGGPVPPGIKYPIKDKATMISPPATPTTLKLNIEMLKGSEQDNNDAGMDGAFIDTEEIRKHEEFIKAQTNEVRFWSDPEVDIDIWCARISEVKEYLTNKGHQYSPNIQQSIQHAQKIVPAGERVIKGWMVYYINLKDFEVERIILVTTENIYKIKYDWAALQVLKYKKYPLTSIHRAKIGRFTEHSKTISSSFRHKLYEKQTGIQVWFKNPSTWKPPSFVQPWAKVDAPYITIRPAVNINSNQSMEEQENICLEIGSAIQCAIHSKRNYNRPIELLHVFARDSPSRSNELSAFPVIKVAQLKRFAGNGIISFALNKWKKTDQGFVDPKSQSSSTTTTTK